MKTFLAFLSILALLAAVTLLLAVPVMLLWNWVGVSVLGLPTVGLFQAWGISLLSHLLFGQSCTNFVVA